MTRLTDRKRAIIAHKALMFKFKKKARQILLKDIKFAQKVYNNVYSKKERDLFESLPKGLMYHSMFFKVQFGSNFTEIGTGLLDCNINNRLRTTYEDEECNGQFERSDLGCVNMLMPYEDRNRCVKIYEATDKLALEFVNITRATQDFKEEFIKAKQQLINTLKVFTTIKQLEKEWKEITQFLPKGETKVLLPALPIDDINNMLGINK